MGAGRARGLEGRRSRWLGASAALLALPGAALLAAVAFGQSESRSLQSAGYAGDEACVACHEESLVHYGATVHAKLLTERNARTEAMKGGCESCHGPGQAHVDAGGGRGEGGPGWISFRANAGEDVDAQNAVCLGCHAGGKHLYWEGSAHDSRGLACTSCHNVMRNVSDDNLLARSNEVDTCAQCHLIRRSQTYRNAHMPLRQGALEEGWMSCTSCHNPHGTVTPKLIAAQSLNDNCYSCHADKRGPFLFEHAPVTESCANCHEPHGSVTIYMLRMPVERLCQNCHVATRHPSQPHGPADRRDFGRGCLHCHNSIHGSNHPSGGVFTR